MKWRGRQGSDNIEDRRGQRSVARTGQIGGVGLLVIMALGYFLGVDVTPLLTDASIGGSTTEVRELTEADQQSAEFVSVVMKDTETIWDEIFQSQLGAEYQAPKVVLFSQVTDSPCGDDTLQRAAGQRPMPHTFTHGSSAQRQQWFAAGYETARLDQCDTFGTDDL